MVKEKFIRISPSYHKKVKMLAVENDSSIKKEAEFLIEKGLEQLKLAGDRKSEKK